MFTNLWLRREEEIRRDDMEFMRDPDSWIPKNIFCLNYPRKRRIIKTEIEIKEVIKTKENKVRKNKYPKEFEVKRKVLLSEARKWKWCTDCNSLEKLTVHHKDKKTYNNDDSNLIVLCYFCHSKHHKHMQWRKPPSFLK